MLSILLKYCTVFACGSARLVWYGSEHHRQSTDEWRGRLQACVRANDVHFEQYVESINIHSAKI